MKIRTYILFIFLFINCQSQSNSKLLETIISHNPVLKNVIDKADTYKPQIIYTQINRDANNNPSFINHTYLLDSTNYFYCASLVKLPCSIFALEKINELNISGLTKDSYMFTDNIYPCQTSCVKDTSSESGYPSLSNYLKKMLLVSDNFSYSRVYEFLNPKYIQKKLAHYGYPKARIIHRFDPACKGEANSMNPIRFFDSKMNLLYKQEADLKSQSFENPLGKIVLGEDVHNKKGKLISEKKDFTYSNYLPLANIHSILQRLLFQIKSKRSLQFQSQFQAQGAGKSQDLSTAVRSRLKNDFGIRSCEITVRDGKDQKFPGAQVRYVSNRCIFKEMTGACSMQRQHRLWAWSHKGKIELKCNGCTKKTNSPTKK